MSKPRFSHPGLAGVLLGLCAVIATPAAADRYFGAAGGAFVPYSGNIGWTVLMEMGADLPNEHFRLGGEGIFATDNEDFNLAAGTVEAIMRVYTLNMVGRYMLFPNRFTPYIGMTGGFKIIAPDDDELSAAGLPTSSGVGFSGGVGGLIGLEWPAFGRDLNFFLEGRADYSWEMTNNLRPFIDQNDFNGFSAVLGMRGRF